MKSEAAKFSHGCRYIVVVWLELLSIYQEVQTVKDLVMSHDKEGELEVRVCCRL